MDERQLKKELAKANQYLPPKAWQRLRRAFTTRGLPFFEFYALLKRIRIGEPPPEDIKREFRRVSNLLVRVKSPIDKRPLSPLLVNQLAETRTQLNAPFSHIMRGTANEITWKRINYFLPPLIEAIAKDKGVYLRYRLEGPERWVRFRNMTAKQEYVAKLEDDDPESYALMVRKGETITQIDQAIKKRIESQGMEVGRAFIMGRPVQTGEDPATGERLIFDRDGDVLPFDEFIKKRKEQERIKRSLSKVPTRTEVPIDDIRSVSDEVVDSLEGQIEWKSLTDDKAKQGRLTKIFATKKYPVDIEGEVQYRHVISSGRYKGVFLDDMINSQGRVIEGTAFGFQEKNGRVSTIPSRIDPSTREPYVTTAEVEVLKEGEGLSYTEKEKKLFLKVPSGRSHAALRNAVKALACNTGAKRGCIPSIVYERVPGSNAAAFYFEPKDFAVVNNALKGMALSSGAMQELKTYYADLSRAEAATAEENLSYYAAEALGGFKTTRKNRDSDEIRKFDLLIKQKQALAWMDARGNNGVCALDTGVGKCCEENTLVLTNKGLVPIKTMNPGLTEPDTTATIEGWSVLVNGESHPVKNFYYGGKKPTFKIRTRRGYEVEGSHIHPLLACTSETPEEWVKTPDLTTNHYLCINKGEPFFPTEDHPDAFLDNAEEALPYVLQSTKETARDFIRAVINDGQVDGDTIQFSSSSEAFCRQLQVLLLRFDVISRRQRANSNWILSIEGIDSRNYCQWIGFGSDISSPESFHTFPHLHAEVYDLSRRIFDRTGYKVEVEEHTYTFLVKLLTLAGETGCDSNESYETICRAVSRNYFYDPIVEIVESEAVVMDIEVDHPSHCFIGNGIVNHNTLVSVSMMQKLIRDGLTAPDATYRVPGGREVTTNGRFLFVCPTSLKGNLPKEIRGFLERESSTSLLEMVDVISYSEFSRSALSGKLPRTLLGVPYWTEREKKLESRGRRANETKLWDIQLYTALIFDEAQELVSSTKSNKFKAINGIYHPRKILLTASPMEKEPEQAYLLAAITNNVDVSSDTEHAKKNRVEMRRFMERFTDRVGGRVIGVKDDPLTKNDLDTWVKANLFYADKTKVEEFELPELRPETLAVQMDPMVEELYREVTSTMPRLMRGLVSKFRDRGVDPETGKIVPEARDPYLERAFGIQFRPILNLLNGLSNYPERALSDIAHMLETRETPDGKPVPRALWRVLKLWGEKYSGDDLRWIGSELGNPKLEETTRLLKNKLDQTDGSCRTLIFSDDKKLCTMTGEYLASRIPGWHVIALNNMIRIVSSGGEIHEVAFDMDPNETLRIFRGDENEARAQMRKLKGRSRIKLPFRKKAYRRHPKLPAHRLYNVHYKADLWQQFVLKEIVSQDKRIKTCTLLGQVYQFGHNLQSFDTVIHLDRDTFSSENMKQRTARAWRQGQSNAVDEITVDATFGEQPDHSELDGTLDEIRRWFQQMESDIFDRIIKDAQSKALGIEWDAIEFKDAGNTRLSQELFELMASPYVGRSTPPGM